MASRQKRVEHFEGPEAASRFDAAWGVSRAGSKEELDRREGAYQESRRDKPRRGPKPSEE
jgi:hypothetical protein